SLRKLKHASVVRWAKRIVLPSCASCRRGTLWSWGAERLRLFYRCRAYRRVNQSISLRSTSGSTRRAEKTLPNRRQNCASGKSVSRAIGNICAGLVVSQQETPDSLNFGTKNLLLCENGFATQPPALRRKYKVIIWIFDSITDSLPTEIK